MNVKFKIGVAIFNIIRHNTYMTLLIMAAGMGSRFEGGIKQMTPIDDNDNLLIDYAVYDAVRAGFDHIVFIINSKIEKDFCERIFNRIKTKVTAEYVIQDINALPDGFKAPKGRTKPWGTVQAILAARWKITKPFCVVNADDFYGAGAYKLSADFLKNNPDENVLIGYDPENTVPHGGTCNRGLCKVDKKDNLVACSEMYGVHRKDGKIGHAPDGKFTPVKSGASFSMNMFGFRPNILPLLHDCFVEFLKSNINVEKSELVLVNAINDLLENKKISAKLLKTDSEWFGLTYAQDTPLVHSRIKKLVKEGVYPKNLWNAYPKDMTLLIMAAGMGSRYGGIKQIDPVGHHGELIIDYSVFDAIRAGFTKVVFVIRREIEEDFRTAIFNRLRKIIDAEYVFQETPSWRAGKPLGTTAAVLAAKDVIKGPFCVINADDFYGAEAFQKISGFLSETRNSSECATVAYDLCNTISEFGTVSRGALSTKDGYVVDIKERICIKRGGEYNFMENGAYVLTVADLKVGMNFFGLVPSVFGHLEKIFNEFMTEIENPKTPERMKRECFLPENLGRLIKEEKITLRTLTTKEKWVGFTYPDDKKYVQKTIQNLVASGVYPSPLWQTPKNEPSPVKSRKAQKVRT